ncbi:MAG: hypothetical protein ABI640_04845 [Gammaproteobacteria bacterium]
MKKLSTLVSARNALLSGLLFGMGALVGCGGGSSTPAAAANPVTPPAVIQGIATPSSVAVVTATNAE